MSMIARARQIWADTVESWRYAERMTQLAQGSSRSHRASVESLRRLADAMDSVDWRAVAFDCHPDRFRRYPSSGCQR